MQIHHLIQGTPEWHAHRLDHDNASDAPAMMGCSPYKTRTELLTEYATGFAADVAPDLQRLYDEGHRAEALARPLAEKIIGEDLYPVVGSEGRLSASFDGLTMMGEAAFEHKLLNTALRTVMSEHCHGALLPDHYQVQMEQQCMVSGCTRVLFMATKWHGDELVEERHCWYESNPVLAARIVAGWAQFHEDLKTFKPEGAKVDPIAAVIDALPALSVTVEGRVLASNLAPFRKAASAFLANINTDLKTDQDFADAARTIKFCGDGEARLALVKEQTLSQTASIAEIFATIDSISEEMRSKRLALTKAVDLRKASIRVEIIGQTQDALNKHVDALNARLGTPWLARVSGNFADAMKGKKTVDSCKEAANVALTNLKIDLSAVADRLDANRKALMIDGVDWFFLFADFASVGTKPVEDFKAIAQARIQTHKDNQAAIASRVAAETVEVAAPAVQVATPAAQTIFQQVAAVQRPASTGAIGTLNAGNIAQRLGFSLTVDFITNDLGIPPATTRRRETLWTEEQFQQVCDHVAAHALRVAKAALSVAA